MLFVIELNLDGYLTEADAEEACRAFIEEQLDFSASSIYVIGRVEKITSDTFQLKDSES